MVDISTPSEKAIADYDKWCQERPETIRDLAYRFKPWKLYKMKSTGHRVVIYSIGDPSRTLTVAVLGAFNLITMERRVFGIEPDDLEECDLPDPNEPVGVILNQEEQLEYINFKRAENGLKPLTQEQLDEYRRGSGVCAIGDEDEQQTDERHTSNS